MTDSVEVDEHRYHKDTDGEQDSWQREKAVGFPDCEGVTLEGVKVVVLQSH